MENRLFRSTLRDSNVVTRTPTAAIHKLRFPTRTRKSLFANRKSSPGHNNYGGGASSRTYSGERYSSNLNLNHNHNHNSYGVQQQQQIGHYNTNDHNSQGYNSKGISKANSRFQNRGGSWSARGSRSQSNTGKVTAVNVENESQNRGAITSDNHSWCEGKSSAHFQSTKLNDLNSSVQSVGHVGPGPLQGIGASSNSHSYSSDHNFAQYNWQPLYIPNNKYQQQSEISNLTPQTLNTSGNSTAIGSSSNNYNYLPNSRPQSKHPINFNFPPPSAIKSPNTIPQPKSPRITTDDLKKHLDTINNLNVFSTTTQKPSQQQQSKTETQGSEGYQYCVFPPSTVVSTKDTAGTGYDNDDTHYDNNQNNQNQNLTINLNQNGPGDIQNQTHCQPDSNLANIHEVSQTEQNSRTTNMNAGIRNSNHHPGRDGTINTSSRVGPGATSFSPTNQNHIFNQNDDTAYLNARFSQLQERYRSQADAAVIMRNKIADLQRENKYLREKMKNQDKSIMDLQDQHQADLEHQGRAQGLHKQLLYAQREVTSLKSERENQDLYVLGLESQNSELQAINREITAKLADSENVVTVAQQDSEDALRQVGIMKDNCEKALRLAEEECEQRDQKIVELQERVDDGNRIIVMKDVEIQQEKSKLQEEKEKVRRLGLLHAGLIEKWKKDKESISVQGQIRKSNYEKFSIYSPSITDDDVKNLVTCLSDLGVMPTTVVNTNSSNRLNWQNQNLITTSIDGPIGSIHNNDFSLLTAGGSSWKMPEIESDKGSNITKSPCPTPQKTQLLYRPNIDVKQTLTKNFGFGNHNQDTTSLYNNCNYSLSNPASPGPLQQQTQSIQPQNQIQNNDQNRIRDPGESGFNSDKKSSIQMSPQMSPLAPLQQPAKQDPLSRPNKSGMKTGGTVNQNLDQQQQDLNQFGTNYQTNQYLRTDKRLFKFASDSNDDFESLLKSNERSSMTQTGPINLGKIDLYESDSVQHLNEVQETQNHIETTNIIKPLQHSNEVRQLIQSPTPSPNPQHTSPAQGSETFGNILPPEPKIQMQDKNAINLKRNNNHHQANDPCQNDMKMSMSDLEVNVSESEIEDQQCDIDLIHREEFKCEQDSKYNENNQMINHNVHVQSESDNLNQEKNMIDYSNTYSGESIIPAVVTSSTSNFEGDGTVTEDETQTQSATQHDIEMRQLMASQMSMSMRQAQSSQNQKYQDGSHNCVDNNNNIQVKVTESKIQNSPPISGPLIINRSNDVTVGVDDNISAPGILSADKKTKSTELMESLRKVSVDSVIASAKKSPVTVVNTELNNDNDFNDHTNDLNRNFNTSLNTEIQKPTQSDSEFKTSQSSTIGIKPNISSGLSPRGVTDSNDNDNLNQYQKWHTPGSLQDITGTSDIKDADN